MAKKNEYSIFFIEGGREVKFAELVDVNQALQLVIALHQSSNVPHLINVVDSDGVYIVKLSNIPINAD